MAALGVYPTMVPNGAKIMICFGVYQWKNCAFFERSCLRHFFSGARGKVRSTLSDLGLWQFSWGTRGITDVPEAGGDGSQLGRCNALSAVLQVKHHLRETAPPRPLLEVELCPQKRHVEVPPPVAVDVILFGNRTFADVITLR